MAMQSEGVIRNQSLGKAMRIIEILAEIPTPARLQDIARKSKIPSSTVVRFLNALVETGYVRKIEQNQGYELTLKITAIGNKVYNKFSYREIIHPYLVSLSESFEESVSLCVEQSDQVVYIDAVDGPGHTLQTLQRIGRVAPMYCTGTGKILLLNYDADTISKKVSGQGLKAFTQHTITTVEQLLLELKEVQRTGIAYDNEECELGVRCIAVPIYDFTQKVIAAMSVSAPVNRLGPERIEQMLPILQHTAAMASRDLGMQSDCT